MNTDPQSRCAHYHSETDIMAIKFKCCGEYFACIRCHEALTGHLVKRWSGSEIDEEAILCGACGAELTIRQYLNCNTTCPNCRARFNPGCKTHWPLYFEEECLS